MHNLLSSLAILALVATPVFAQPATTPYKADSSWKSFVSGTIFRLCDAQRADCKSVAETAPAGTCTEAALLKLVVAQGIDIPALSKFYPFSSKIIYRPTPIDFAFVPCPDDASGKGAACVVAQSPASSDCTLALVAKSEE